MSDLPVNIDTTYADDAGDASVALHQQHHDAIHAFYNDAAGATLLHVGTAAAPVTDANLARPSTTSPVYWVCANGVTPVNAQDADLIWNASA